MPPWSERFFLLSTCQAGEGNCVSDRSSASGAQGPLSSCERRKARRHHGNGGGAGVPVDRAASLPGSWEILTLVNLTGGPPVSGDRVAFLAAGRLSLLSGGEWRRKRALRFEP